VDLKQLQVQGAGLASRNPVVPALLTGIDNEDEMSVAIHFDRDTSGSGALRTIRQASVGVGHRREPSVSCGHRNTIEGDATSTIPLRSE